MNIFFNSLLKNWKTKTGEIYKEKGKKVFCYREMFIVQIWDVTSNIFNINIFWLILQFTSSNSIKGKETNKLGVCVWKILNRI
jgi:hypothetical protein